MHHLLTLAFIGIYVLRCGNALPSPPTVVDDPPTFMSREVANTCDINRPGLSGLPIRGDNVCHVDPGDPDNPSQAICCPVGSACGLELVSSASCI
jgi:hypothetical protein